MPVQTIPADLGELRTLGTAGGQALTSTSTIIQIPNGTVWLTATPRNFSTAVAVRLQLNPYLLVFKTTDNLAARANQTDYSDEAQDSSTATDITLSSLSTAAASDFMFVGAHVPFRGVLIDVDAANGTASIVTVKYRKSDNTWADITATDGTASGGAAMAVDGSTTWTVPTDWLKTTLKDAYRADAVAMAGNIKYGLTPMYWTRWEFSGGLDSSTTLNSMVSLGRLTTYLELQSGQAYSQALFKGPEGFGAIEANTDAGTANLSISVGAGRMGFV